jgi:glutaredoxin-like protein
MALIPDRDRDDLKREFRKELKNDVTIRLFTQGSSLLTVPGQECKYCPQTQQLMEELTALSPKLNLQVYNFYSQTEEAAKYGVERIPAVVMGENGDGRLKFYGIPMGNEFPIIIEGIKTISRGVSPLSMDSRKKLKRVNHPVHIQVFVTPT